MKSAAGDEVAVFGKKSRKISLREANMEWEGEIK